MKKLAIITAFLLVTIPVMTSAQTIVDVSGLGQGSVPQGQTFSTGNPGTSLTSCKVISSYGLIALVGCLIGVMNNALYLIMAASVLYVVWGAFQLMKEEKREEAKNTVLYGIIGLFVMISIWGLVNILDRTFNLTGPAKAPPALTPR